MIEQSEWVFFRDIDWDDKQWTWFNVDTRDFHVGYNNHEAIDARKLLQYPDFFWTAEEIKALLERLFEESGGPVKWRYLSVDGSWELKYLRICRHEEKFIVCNSNRYALRKKYLNQPINTEHLNAH